MKHSRAYQILKERKKFLLKRVPLGIKKSRKSGFGILKGKGISSFSKEDELDTKL